MSICEVENCENHATYQICASHQRDVRYWRIPHQPHWRTRPNPACEIPGCGRASQSKKLSKCKLHLDHERAGRDLSTIRPKTRNHAKKPRCSQQDCDARARSRGLCDKHYSRSQNPPRLFPCKHETCTKMTSRGFCAGHHPSRLAPPWPSGPCGIVGCKNQYRSKTHDLCKHHMRTRMEQGLTADELKEIRNSRKCSSCGAEGPVVVDHLHNHHPERRSRMCKQCIRGPLCQRCNTALGLLDEEPKKILSLLSYIQNTAPGAFFEGADSGLNNPPAPVVLPRAA